MPRKENHKVPREFLETCGGLFCQKAAELLGIQTFKSSLLTHVEIAIDQRYSYGMAELNFDIYCNPHLTARMGANQLYDRLLRRFSTLGNIDVQLTYLSGITHETDNEVRRKPQT